jgi:hypothetical protein
MKKKIQLIIPFITLLISFHASAQYSASANKFNYEMRYLFTGTVNEPFDSVFIFACVINNINAIHPVKLFVYKKKDSQEIDLTGNNGGPGAICFYSNQRLFVPLGYLDPANTVDSLIIEQQSGNHIVLYQKSQDYFSVTDTTLYYQLKHNTDLLYKK